MLHWLIALLLAVEIGLGFGMPKGASGFALYQLHKSIGITILALTLVRVGWRITHRPPPPLEGGLSGLLAKAVHLGFYGFLLLAPLTGWAVASTAPVEIPTILFGLVPLPHLPLPATLNEPAEAAHELLAFAAIALFTLHVAGALRHHFLMADGLLARMAPGGSSLTAVVLGAAVVLAGGLGFSLAPLSGEDAAGVEAPAAGAAPAVPDLAEAGAEQPEESVAAQAGTAEPAEGAEASDDPASLAAPANIPPPEWNILPGGNLSFSVTNGADTIGGSFARWSGAVTFDPDKPENAQIAIEVDLASASVGDATQDGMLKGEEFFAVASGPLATYRSGAVRQLGANSYEASGTLRLKGVSRAQAVRFRLSGQGTRRQVSGSATIDRKAFAIGTGSAAANLGEAVSLRFAFDAEMRAR